MTEREQLSALTAQLAELSGHVVRLAMRVADLEARQPLVGPTIFCGTGDSFETSLQRNRAAETMGGY